jgi:SAM-dependent methyltransferase
MTEIAYSGRDNLDVMQEAENYNRFLLDLVSSNARQAIHMVDFGAGSGTFAKPLSSPVRRLICVEPDPVLSSMLREQHLEVIDSIDSLDDGSIDFLYSLNVLEHIADDRSIARAWFRKLRPGGRALAYVPAFQALYTSMDRKVGHVRRYSRRTLCDCLTGAGFRIDEARYADSIGVLATLAYRLVDNGQGSIDLRMLKTYDKWIFPVSRLIDGVSSRAFGKNVYAVAVKPVDDAAAASPA